MPSTKTLVDLLYQKALDELNEPLPTWMVAPIDPNVPVTQYVQNGQFTLSRLIQALQDLQGEAGDVPVKVQLESDWDREWEPIEQIEFERDSNGKISALRLR